MEHKTYKYEIYETDEYHKPWRCKCAEHPRREFDGHGPADALNRATDFMRNLYVPAFSFLEALEFVINNHDCYARLESENGVFTPILMFIDTNWYNTLRIVFDNDAKDVALLEMSDLESNKWEIRFKDDTF